MQIIPAIDLREGRCVRLVQGDYEQETRYDANPVELAQRYADAGARLLHVVDLDGAKKGSMVNREVVASLTRITGLKIQVGGGLRREEDVAEILELGAERAVIGSTAVRDPAQVKSWIEKFGGDRILLALDVRWVETEYRVAVSGWTETANATLWDTLAAYRGSGLRYVLCTDIGRDGMLTGPNLMLYREMVDRMPKLNIQASGGVGKRADLKQLQQTHVSGAIVGKALLDGQVELEVLQRGAFGQ